MQQATYTLVNRLESGPLTHLRISGVIDESFSPGEVSAAMRGHVLLDLGRVERMSSFGVRQWMELSSALPRGVEGICLINAPACVVDQLNMVEGFVGITRTLSVLAPYACEGCGEDRVRLVDLVLDAEAIKAGLAPEHTCPVCSAPLEFTDTPAEFFEFAGRQLLGDLEPQVQTYLRLLRPGEQQEASADLKLVEGDVTFVQLPGVLGGDLNVRRLGGGLEGRVVFDFAGVARVEAGGAERLHQLLEQAGGSARVVLWRVPPPVLEALKSARRRLPVELGTLWLPCGCAHCGAELPQRFEAGACAAGGAIPEECPVCGAGTHTQEVPEFGRVLAVAPAAALPQGEYEALETQALSRAVASATAREEREAAASVNAGAGLNLQVLRRIGQGGMAEVFLARQQGLQGFEKYVVVKKILDHLAQSPDFVEMLFAEARANARLTHPNIVQTYDVGVSNGAPCITMEYVRGPDLKKLITWMRRAQVKLPLEIALRIVAETAAGLSYAHDYVDPQGVPHPIIHRDVSPHNILVSLDGAIKLSDFGIAKAQGETHNTRPGTFKGKIAYVSPEAVAGKHIDSRNDVFGLGVVCFELLTGKLPFTREQEAATLRAILNDPTPDPLTLNAFIPPDVGQIVMHSLAKRPEKRIQSAALMRDAIEEAMARHGLLATPVSVARFFQEQLPRDLTEYGPATAGGGAKAPARAPSQPSPRRPGEPASKEITATAESRARSGSSSSPLPVPAPVVRAGAGADVRPDVTPVAAPPRRAAPVASPPPPARAPPPAPPAPRAAPAAAQPAQRYAPAPPAQPQLSAVAEQRAASLDPTPSAAVASRPRTSNLARWVGGGVAVLVVVTGLATGMTRGSDTVSVYDLPSDENLYIDGVRSDPRRLRLDATELVLVSTARGGRLHRVGRAMPAGGIDINSLVVTQSDGRAGEADLSVVTVPPVCSVEIDGRLQPGTTPMTLQIATGRETQVELSCPGRPTWARHVMAIPGQKIELFARATND